jgi:lipoprotein-anchoring transpeptidase ErfK/SrfK
MLNAKTCELMPSQDSGGVAFALPDDMKTLLTLLSVVMGTAVLAQEPAAKRETARQPAANSEPGPSKTAAVVSEIVAAQVMLDRAGFSPGEIDGQAGANLKRAASAFQKSNGVAESGQVDHETWQRLAEVTGNQPPLVEYQIREADFAGPFTPTIPEDLVEQSKLDALGYQNALEAIAERFHASPQLLRELNPGQTFAAANQTILVPNVNPFELPQPAPDVKQNGARGQGGRRTTAGTTGVRGGGASQPAFTIAVTKSTSALTVEDSSGRVVFHAPVTTGSEHDPLPIGKWKVTEVFLMPPFRYNPDLFWDANPAHTKVKIAPGPNNPVGIAWIDLSKEHYGIHGTPQPSRIGHVQSHGCVRLTNWDAQRLLQWAQPGTAVVFRE